MYITFDNGRFIAPLDAPYKDLLVLSKWYKTGAYFYTKEVDNVVPVLAYLEPKLRDAIFEAETSYHYSRALEPSGDVVLPYPEIVRNGEVIKPLGFQLVDAEFIVKHEKTLLAEDPGTGKSCIITVAANALDVKNALFVVPSIAKYNWAEKEWPMWTTLKHLSVGVAEGSYYPEGSDVVIINYDIIDRFKDKLNEKVWDYVVYDEAHRLGSPESRRTVYSLGGYYKDSTEYIPPIPAKKTVFATATPMDKPIQLWSIIRACDPKGLGADRMAYEKRYCAAHPTVHGWDNRGAAHLEELGGRLRNTFMVRHNPEEILNLPPMREEIFLLPPIKIVLKAEQEFVEQNIEALLELADYTGIANTLTEESSTEQFMTFIGEAVLQNVDLIGSPAFNAAFQQYAEIRKLTGVAKVPMVADFVKEMSNDESIPFVVFAYHREVIETLSTYFKNPAVVMGGLTSKARKREVDRFQGGDTNIFIGNMDAAGEAIDLVRANMLAIAEPDWRARTISQVKKRIHRITQDNPCTVYHIAAAKSFDAIVSEVSLSKKDNVEKTLTVRKSGGSE